MLGARRLGMRGKRPGAEENRPLALALCRHGIGVLLWTKLRSRDGTVKHEGRLGDGGDLRANASRVLSRPFRSP